ncbi:conjugative transfer system coupling protein TraD [Sulfuricystis multivorans]|uniref:conjugative transfer system coupling protein TraD n=1 Tax=Sulfuricystis multivorans TaxID=2211108 RepID=UPI000F81A9CE|nr:conjugative transfer system coupling protein TraD [Sulfuricystis multivorans]
MLLRQFEMPWRKAYEAYSAAVWFLCVIGLTYAWYTTSFPDLPFYYLGATALVFMIFNLLRAWEIWRLKWSLGGKGISFITDEELKTKVTSVEGQENSRALWFGKGFDWTPVHTQRVYEIKRADPEQFYPPKMIMWMIEQWSGEQVGANTTEYIGAPWIHGLNGSEDDLYVPIQNLIGNTLLVGTTRCGKTRFLELIAEMAIELGYTVICIDPKGDQPFDASLRAACKQAGREHDYVRFHLAFPGQSARIDPLKNYTNPSDLASRIAALMPGGDKSSSFRDFAWGVLNAIVMGMLATGEKPSLVRIRSYVDNGIADLLMRVILQFFDEELQPNWETEVAAYARTLKQVKGKKGQEDGEILVRQSLNLLLEFYLDMIVPRGIRDEAIEALATIYKHDSAHYTKMIANLVPILGMLTTGELGDLLSPDPRDVADTRPMTDLASLIRANSVVSIGLDSLANKTISSAVGSMLLSDLTSVAAAFYNYGGNHKVFLIVDEAAEVVNDPYIQMLNKSAGAGFINLAAIQTIPDLAARFESMDKARQMLGNFNNLVSMRIKDRVTQDFVTETFGQTYVYTQQKIHATSSSTEKTITHFTGSVQERVTEALEDVLPPDVLGQLPNWQYIAMVSGGRLIKGRLPIISHEEA